MLIGSCLAAAGLFLDTTEELVNANCMVKIYSEFSFRMFTDSGAVDPLFIKNVLHIRGTGASVILDGYVMPCIGCDVQKQVNEIIRVGHEAKLNRLWVVVEGKWSVDRALNLLFLQKLYVAFSHHGIVPEIRTTELDWNRIIGSHIQEFHIVPLWFINHDGNPDGGFKPFAGWEKPAAKQYFPSAQDCGHTYNRNSRF